MRDLKPAAIESEAYPRQKGALGRCQSYAASNQGRKVLLGGGAALLLVVMLLNSGGIGSGLRGTVDVRDVMLQAVALTAAAGEEVVKIRRSGALGQKSKGTVAGGVDDPLTMADLTSHRILTSGLRAAFPGVNVISEEKDSENVGDGVISIPAPVRTAVEPVLESMPSMSVAREDITVWVDPLDATKEYTEDLTWYVTVMICVAVRGEPVGGIIHYPFSQRTLWGVTGSGVEVPTLAGVHNVSLKAVPAPGPEAGTDHAKVWKAPAWDWSAKGVRTIVSRSHAGKVKDQILSAGVDVAGVTPAGGAGFKTGQVLAGVEDIYIHSTLIKKWDVCAGDALLRASAERESGRGVAGEGSVNGLKTWYGEEISYGFEDDIKVRNGLVATEKKGLYDTLLPRLTTIMKEQQAAA